MKQLEALHLRCDEEFPSWNYIVSAEECESIFA
jgi:hypothetical protein